MQEHYVNNVQQLTHSGVDSLLEALNIRQRSSFKVCLIAIAGSGSQVPLKIDAPNVYKVILRCCTLYNTCLAVLQTLNPMSAHTYTLCFYRAMLCIRGTSHGPVSVCVCMCFCLSQVGVLLKQLNQRFSNWGPRTKGGPRRVPTGSARRFQKVVIVCTVFNNLRSICFSYLHT